MKIFQSKKIWQKLVVIILFILLFKFMIITPVYAGSDDGVLLEPITGLFANLGDGIMEIMQKTFLGVESSGAWVEQESNTWLKILLIAAAIIIAVVSIVSTIVSGGAALTIVMGIAAAVIKIGIATRIAFFAVDTLNLGSSGFYLPEYELTLHAIFSDEILAFDVNFFNPEKREKVTLVQSSNSIKLPGTSPWGLSGGGTAEVNVMPMQYFNSFKKKYEFDETKAEDTGNEVTIFHQRTSIGMKEKEWKTSEEKKYRVYYSDGEQGLIDNNHRYIYDLRDVTETKVTKIVSDEYSPAYILQPTIASWYLALRNIALIALLSILVYIGIRITLTSVAGDKAKYKQMLVDWVVALALVFLMHYIMSFAVSINELIIEAIDSITVSTYGSQKDIVGDTKDDPIQTNAASFDVTDGEEVPNEDPENVKPNAAGTELFIINDKTQVQAAYKVLVGEKGDKEGTGDGSSFYNRFGGFDSNGENPTVLYWPTSGFMEQARLLGQHVGATADEAAQTKVARAGYNIIYTVLVIYTVIFCFTYLKRLIYMAFLTLIAPLVAITYPIDKISDGKAQAFDMWLKEYIFNLLIQPLHLILYSILIGMAMKFAATNIFYTIVALGFLVPAEKILRRFFRFERAQTPGVFAGPAGAALMMSGLSRLMRRSSNKSRLGSGKDDESEKDSKVSTYRNGKDPMDEIGEGKDKDPKIISNKDKDTANNAAKNDKKTETEGKGNKEQSGENPSRKIDIPNSKNTNTEKTATKKVGGKTENNTGKNNKRIRLPRARRAIRRGLSSYGKGIQKRYKAKGGIARRALRTSAGLASAATMAAAGGIIGIASGDPSKAAQYMAAGAAGGYKLGKTGVDKAADGINERFKEPMKQAKVGFYGEEEYQRREHEKWKKREFEKNTENIQRIQEKYNMSWKEAKEKSKEISRYTDTDGINDFNSAFAVDQLKRDGYSEAEALTIGKTVNKSLDGQGADKMKREDREQFLLDLRDKLIGKGMSRKEATDEAKKMLSGTNKFAKYSK